MNLQITTMQNQIYEIQCQTKFTNYNNAESNLKIAKFLSQLILVKQGTKFNSRPAVNVFQWFRLKMILQSWNLAQSYLRRSMMGVYLPGSVAIARTKIFKMASDSHFE